MLVITRKIGQKIMIGDNIVVTIADVKNGQCKIAIDADKDVKIYREEIYYQIKFANLVGKNTDAACVDSVTTLLKNDKLELNKDMGNASETNDIIINQSTKTKYIIQKNKKED